MRQNTVTLGGYDLPAYTFHTVVVGTGCAGYNAADRLHHYGQTNIAIVTDHVQAGTSRNTGSDKQTYYKLTLSGNEPDSVQQMAETYFEGQCMDGDHALCEAALSARCFLRLCDLGVPFPVNRYGEYIGYKTDHDPRRRATSVGPLTSRQMTEALERSVKSKGIEILDHHQVIAILTDEGRVAGLLCLCTDMLKTKQAPFSVIFCQNIIYATGGPAGIYADSCYPLGHYGMSGAAFEAGAMGKNLTEWQYGLASIKPRWNVSGTFMQVLPRFISTDAQGGNEREFLPDYLPDSGALLTNVFLKGYQWPFDTRKAMHGSSLIDLFVYTETKVKGRRVWLDFRQNPLGEHFSFDCLSPEAYDYLDHAGALFGTPIERLEHMNAPAIEFYRSRGVDLTSEPLEIALCSQHNNGGVAVDAWWQSNVKGLFVVGEAAGTHGVTRPGGSALNAGQVGSERAAIFCANIPEQPLDAQALSSKVNRQAEKLLRMALGAHKGQLPVQNEYRRAIAVMSKSGAAVRNMTEISALRNEVLNKLEQFPQQVGISGAEELPLYFRYRDILISQLMYLSAMEDYVQHGGKSRGASLYTDPAGQKPLPSLPECLRFIPDDGTLSAQVQELCLQDGKPVASWRAVRPIPAEDDFFENVWRRYREDKNIY